MRSAGRLWENIAEAALGVVIFGVLPLGAILGFLMAGQWTLNAIDPDSARETVVTIASGGFQPASVASEAGNTDNTDDLIVAFKNITGHPVTLTLLQDRGCVPDGNWLLGGAAAQESFFSSPKDVGCLTVRPGQEVVTSFLPSSDPYSVGIEGMPSAKPLAVIPAQPYTHHGDG
jgi:hypothetical protein